MNTIERFKEGKKVKTKYGEYSVGSFIKVKGENYWRRINSDGKATIVEKGKLNDNELPSKIRNELIKSSGGVHGKDGNHWTNKLVNTYSFITNISGGWILNKILDATGINSKKLNLILRNTEGEGNGWDLLSIATGAFRNNYYDGKLHDNKDKKNNGRINAQNIYSNNFYEDNRNLINLYTQQNDAGFESSKLGLGLYKNHPEYSKYPAYEGNFYGIDTLYLPSSSKQYFKNNLNSNFNQDHDVLIKGMKSFEGLDDVRNYNMTPKYIDGKYYVDMEDVWNLDKAGFDSRNYPFILNLRIPVIFTNDLEKLNIVPELSNWFDIPSSWSIKK